MNPEDILALMCLIITGCVAAIWVNLHVEHKEMEKAEREKDEYWKKHGVNIPS